MISILNAMRRLFTVRAVVKGCALVLALVVGSLLFRAYYYNLVAESFFITALLRMVHGLPVGTGVTDLPVFPNPYSEYYFWLVYPLLKLLGAHDLSGVALVARSFSLAWFIACVAAVAALTRRVIGGESLKFDFWFGVVLLVAFFPGTVIAARMDLISVFFEALGVLLFYRWFFEKRGAGVAAGSAAAFVMSLLLKLNTLGAFGGILLFLLLRRRLGTLLLFGGGVAGGTALAIFLTDAWISPTFLDSLALALRAKTLPLPEVVNALSAVLTEQVLAKTAFHVVLLLGFLWLQGRGSGKTSVFFGCILLSAFTLAAIGQMKQGAGHNYFFSFYLLALVPFVAGLRHLDEVRSEIRFILLAAVSILLLVATVQALRFPVTFVASAPRYPYKDVRAYLDEEFPEGYIYSSENNALLHLWERTLVQTWAEPQLQHTPGLQDDVNTLLRRIKPEDFAVAVIPGSGCADWKPSGLFEQHLKELTHLRKRMGNICIFSRPNSKP